MNTDMHLNGNKCGMFVTHNMQYSPTESIAKPCTPGARIVYSLRLYCGLPNQCIGSKSQPNHYAVTVKQCAFNCNKSQANHMANVCQIVKSQRVELGPTIWLWEAMSKQISFIGLIKSSVNLTKYTWGTHGFLDISGINFVALF